MVLHKYRSRQFHRTSNGINPSSSFRDMRSAKSGPNLWQIGQDFWPTSKPIYNAGAGRDLLHLAYKRFESWNLLTVLPRFRNGRS